MKIKIDHAVNSERINDAQYANILNNARGGFLGRFISSFPLFSTFLSPFPFVLDYDDRSDSCQHYSQHNPLSFAAYDNM